MKTKPEIQIDSIARAMATLLPEWRKWAKENGEDAAVAREALILEDKNLRDAFYKSDYTKLHIDWDYAVELIQAVLETDDFEDAKGFADKLNVAVKETAESREFIVIVPLGFPSSFAPVRPSNPIKSQLALGEFGLAPQTSTVGALNDLLTTFGAHPVDDSLFAHQVLASRRALVSHPLVLFEAHGSPDQIPRQSSQGIRRLICLIEVFGRTFDAESFTGLMVTATSNHLFLVNKRTGRLSRIPLRQSSAVSYPLSRSLIRAIKRPEIAKFLDLLASDQQKNLVGRLRNALEFFGRAVGEQNEIARFLFLVIAMEAIFSRDKHTPIKATLADYATLLCFKGEERREIHNDLRKIYDVRSSIVHNGVTNVDQSLLRKAERLAARAMYCSLLLAYSVKNGTGSLEDRFFGRLRDMKIGISSNDLKIPNWAGYGLSGIESLA